MLWVDDTKPPLDQKRKDTLHSVNTKCLYITNRGSPAINPTVVLLCTIVAKRNEDDWKKLERLLVFLKNTIDDKICIGVFNIESLYTWIDAKYAVHPDMKIHIGGAILFGQGMLHCRPGKQKLNTNRSTEAEIVGVSDYLPYHINLVMFLEHQGYTILNNIVFQENQSSINMETNGRNPCKGNSRHIALRYFFTKDRIRKG